MTKLELKKTKDDSLTFYNYEFKESYHSPEGAKRESFQKHAIPSKVKDIENAKVLDYCFGLGYNTAAALDLFLKSNNKFIEVIAIENDPDILDKISTISQDFESFHIIKKLVQEQEIGIGVNDKAIKAELIVDDCLKAVPKLDKNSFDVVFFDPFSPKKCPELWTELAFKQVFNVMKKGAILTTYSCSKLVRENMAKAGFKVMEGPDIDQGHPGTLAIKE